MNFVNRLIPPAAQTPGPAAGPSAAVQPVKCLLVDDLEENLLATSALLASPEVEVLTARSGHEALELLLTHDVALALLDVQMPEMDGFELAELMRGTERTRHVPLIFVTAGARDQHRLFKGYDTGAVDFLYKPIDPRILLNKAEVFFQLHRQKLQLAHELRERTEMLRLNEMFMAVLGHDLRNPLSAILATAQVLQLGGHDAAVSNGAARVESCGRRMSRMIDDLLDVTRARLGSGLALKAQACDLAPLVTRVVQEHRTTHPDRAITLQASGDLNGVWDADRLGQAVSNLVGNALQHGEAGPVAVLLDGRSPTHVALSVSNPGTIAAEAMPGLFDPFRSGERRDGSEGLGLGLYIVQQVVQSHGGTIDVSSSVGAAPPGTTRFQVRLPRQAMGSHDVPAA